jgi:hypothetical protein
MAHLHQPLAHSVCFTVEVENSASHWHNITGGYLQQQQQQLVSGLVRTA